MADDTRTEDDGGTRPDDPDDLESVATAEVFPTPRPSHDREMLAGRTGDRYRLRALLAEGGMGEILSAADEQIGREVAIKRMKKQFPTQHAMGRFFREACIQGRLDHPAIVPVHELGVDSDGRPFFAMKKLAGTTLTDLIAKGHSRQRLLRAFAEVCFAIEFAHERNVVHRDLKPDNILLGDYGDVYVLDWGVARVLSEPAELRDEGVDAKGSNERRRDAIVAEPMTLDGTVIGTRGYMAPEQARAEPDVDGRADVYSLGCVLFEILAGVPRNPAVKLPAETTEAKPSVRAPQRDVPPELDELCVAATREDREERIQSPRELAERIERYLDGDRDLELRTQLAKDHLEEARAAFAAGEAATAEQRRRAMREAGRALALDPRLDGAGELVGRLMIEPPRERPREMQRMVDADDLDTLQRMAKAAGTSFLGFLAFLPLMFRGDPVQIGYLVALAAVIGLNLLFLLPARSYADLNLRTIRLVASTGLLVALLGRMMSPFLIAPVVAVLSAVSLVFSPTCRTIKAALMISGSMVVAVLLPWIAELAGVVSTTTHFDVGGLLLDPPMLAISPFTRHAMLVLYVVAVMAAATAIAFQNRKAERIVRERLHMQTWQLRQLVG